MTHFVDDRAVCWLERGVLFLLLLFLGGHTLPHAWGKLNTDFPNYYTSARIAREGFDTSRMYEWVWLQREKDHRAEDIRVIGLLPITPISTLPIWPLTRFPALTAKHVWIVANLVLLVPLCWLLRLMTGLPYRRIGLAFALSFPLHKDLLFGQFYVLLLLLIVAACWAYLEEKPALAGALIAVAAACKMFPVLFFVWFLQRRAWRSLIAGAVTGLAAIGVSVAAFGWSVHRTYLHEILPWTLHGEGLPPYAVQSASISSILHYLFLYEPQWNPHPWHASVLWYALLQPTLPLLVLAPAILLIDRKALDRRRVLLEWSALLVALLAISTIPASYNFVLLAFPVCVLAALLLERKHYGWLAALVIAYIGIGFPLPTPTRMIGPAILLYVPRLPLVLGLLAFIYWLLLADRPVATSPREWTRYAWAAVLVVVAVTSVRSTFQREVAMRTEYAYRLPIPTQALLEASPKAADAEVEYLAFVPSGYHLQRTSAGALWGDTAPGDDLGFSGGLNHTLVEKALSPKSNVVELRYPSRTIVADAREPMLSVDGTSLAFVRDDHGRGSLMERRNFRLQTGSDAVLTSPSLNVYEASFLSEQEYAFSAVEGSRPPQIYLTDGLHRNTPLHLGESRYPALSPDGRWLAYSHFDDGAWNLWIRSERTGETRRIANVPCNEIEPSWEGDSETLLYGTDCGRSLWFTAVARRRVVP
jgi:Glycosyltransferase family 87/WD40-like Beta Propeller Repeat